VGAVAGGVPVDLTSSTKIFDDGSLFSGLAVGTCIGLSRAYPDVDLLGVLTPQGEALVASAAEMTLEQLAVSFPFLQWGDYLTVPGVFEIPGMRSALESIRLGQATPTTRLYLYHAVHDQNLAVADVDKLVEKYRREGVDVSYRRFRFGEHMIVMVTGVPSSLQFLGERFGNPVRRRWRRARPRPAELNSLR
jgi:Secretory lipase